MAGGQNNKSRRRNRKTNSTDTSQASTPTSPKGAVAPVESAQLRDTRIDSVISSSNATECEDRAELMAKEPIRLPSRRWTRTRRYVRQMWIYRFFEWLWRMIYYGIPAVYHALRVLNWQEKVYFFAFFAGVMFASWAAVEGLQRMFKVVSAQENCSVVYVTIPGPIITVSLIGATPSDPARGTYYYSVINGSTEWLNSITPPSRVSSLVTSTLAITITPSSLQSPATFSSAISSTHSAGATFISSINGKSSASSIAQPSPPPITLTRTLASTPGPSTMIGTAPPSSGLSSPSFSQSPGLSMSSPSGIGLPPTMLSSSSTASRSSSAVSESFPLPSTAASSVSSPVTSFTISLPRPSTTTALLPPPSGLSSSSVSRVTSGTSTVPGSASSRLSASLPSSSISTSTLTSGGGVPPISSSRSVSSSGSSVITSSSLSPSTLTLSRPSNSGPSSPPISPSSLLISTSQSPPISSSLATSSLPRSSSAFILPSITPSSTTTFTLASSRSPILPGTSPVYLNTTFSLTSSSSSSTPVSSSLPSIISRTTTPPEVSSIPTLPLPGWNGTTSTPRCTGSVYSSGCESYAGVMTTRVISYGNTQFTFAFPTPDITTTVSYWTGSYPTVTGSEPSPIPLSTRTARQSPISDLPSFELFRPTASLTTFVTTVLSGSMTRTRTEVAAAEATSCGEYGNFTLTFDDTAVGPDNNNLLPVNGMTNPYHHLFYANGYTYVPDKWEPYPAESQPNVAMFLPIGASLLPNSPFAGTLLPGEIGAGPRAPVSAYWFNAYSGFFGCALNGITACTLRISGYRYDATLRQEVVAVEQNVTIAPCWGYIRCRLTQVNFTDQFRALSGIQFNAYTYNLGIPQIFMMDSLQMEWYNNTCAAGILRIGHHMGPP